MTARELAELASTRSPFATDGNGGVDPKPETDPAGTWSRIEPIPLPDELLSSAGIYRTKGVGGTVVIERYSAPKKKPASKRGVVTDNVDQNKHMWAMLNDRELSPTELAVGTRIAYYAFAPSSRGKCEKARATLADHCGVSESTFRRAAQNMVERGYFKRVDTGKGGRAGRGKSAYVPTLPEWLSQGVH